MTRNLVIVPSLKDENLAVSKKSLTLYDTIAIDFKVAKEALQAGVKIRKGKKVFHKASLE